MKLEIYEDNEGFWRWRFRARNGRLVAESGEGFKTRANALRAVRAFTCKVPETGIN